LNEATTKLGPCQVRSKTEQPCLRRAEMEILGVAFCEPCAREQEAYFAVGELTQEKHGLRNKVLAEVLGRMRRERNGGREDIAA
jgi:FXSXX-COOH protein